MERRTDKLTPEEMREIILEGLRRKGPMGWYRMDRWVTHHPDFDWHKDDHWKPVWDAMLADGTLEMAPGYEPLHGVRRITGTTNRGPDYGELPD